MKTLNLVILILILSSCTSSFKTESDFYSWVNDQSNGLLKERTANGFVISAKYLPPEYLAYKESGKTTGKSSKREMLLEEFNKSKTFLLSIDYQSHDLENRDVAEYKVQNMPEYENQIRELNFSMKEHIYIRTSNGKKYKPVLATMENIYHLSTKKSIYLVFADEQQDKALTNASELDLVFEDEIFDTGINHFVFNKAELNNIPEFDFIKMN